MNSYLEAGEVTDKMMYKVPDLKPAIATFIIKIVDDKHEPVAGVDFGVAINKKKMEIQKIDKNGILEEYEPNIEKITLSLIGKHVYPPKKKNEHQEYEVRITTGNIENSGTDSNVYIKFFGDKCESSETMLNPLIKGNAFEKGNTDIVTIITQDIGNLNSIRIWHDNKYPNSGWFLNKIVVINKKTGQSAEFPCYKWLSDDEGDKKIDRTLKPGPLKPRPFYIIAHMCNTPDYVDEAIKDGANAIECDITVEKNKNDVLEFTVHHGTIIGILGYGIRAKVTTPISQYLSYMRSNQDRFTIVIFDCKPQEKDISPSDYGQKLCEIIKKYLPANKCIMSIPYVSMKKFFEGMKYAGFDNAGKDISEIVEISLTEGPQGKDPDFWITTAEKYGANWLGMGNDAHVPFSPLRNWITPLVHSAQGRDKNEMYLFSWDDIPGNDSKRLIEFLKQEFGISWVETGKIEKIDNDRNIRVTAKRNYLSLSLNNEKTMVNLKIDDGRSAELVAKSENGKLNIYNEIVKKVYYWTLEDSSSMSRVLATDIDGIIVNNPSTLKNLLEKEEFKHTFRLAKNNDNPFVVFKQ